MKDKVVNISLSLSTAREWYKGNNEALRQMAINAFGKKELKEETFEDIYTAEVKNIDCICLDMPKKVFDKAKILAKLSIIANYLNDNWEPIDSVYAYTLSTGGVAGYIDTLSGNTNVTVRVDFTTNLTAGAIYFKSYEDTQKAWNLLSKEEKEILF